MVHNLTPVGMLRGGKSPKYAQINLERQGPETEDRHLLDQEGSLETQWSTSEFSKQDPVILFLKLKGGRPCPNT